MNDEKETKQRLLENAKKEFMEKGYMQASLRNICKNAEVTTGALYFFFVKKEALFADFVEKPLQELYDMIHQNFQEEMRQIEVGNLTCSGYANRERIAKQLLHYMYCNYDAFLLLFTKSQGSKYERFLDEFIEITEKHCRVLANHISMQKNIPKLDECMIHWIAHTQVDFFVYVLTHEKSEHSATKHIEAIMKCLASGWTQLFQA